MDFAHVRFTVRVDHEGVDLFFVFECTDHRESAVGRREGHFHELQGVGD